MVLAARRPGGVRIVVVNGYLMCSWKLKCQFSLKNSVAELKCDALPIAVGKGSHTQFGYGRTQIGYVCTEPVSITNVHANFHKQACEFGVRFFVVGAAAWANSMLQK
jgi:hypothetical protein